MLTLFFRGFANFNTNFPPNFGPSPSCFFEILCYNKHTF